MTVVAVIGDCTTTTCLALAATWPTDGGNPDPTDVLVLEADPSGGSLAGWLGTPNGPTLGTIVANTTSGRPAATMDTIESMVLTSDSGVRLIAAPTRTLPARRAIEEAAAAIVPALASASTLVALTDLGRSRVDESRPILDAATVVVVTHCQTRTSAAAEAVRLERLIESVELVGATIVLGVIGGEPFDPSEIVDFVSASVPDAVAESFLLAEDVLAAAVLAGRTGVSARRLARLPLMRSARAAARRLSATTRAASPAGSIGSR